MWLRGHRDGLCRRVSLSARLIGTLKPYGLEVRATVKAQRLLACRFDPLGFVSPCNALEPKCRVQPARPAGPAVRMLAIQVFT